ncbi:MAG TPA: hypothetical protein VMT74_05865 [Gaiellaceae bacterium]|nr:hypothetical protein [Gaiellaceae bacterium]
MELVITPKPSDEERAAIEAALEAESSEAAEPHSSWPDALLPLRGDPLDPEPS